MSKDAALIEDDLKIVRRRSFLLLAVVITAIELYYYLLRGVPLLDCVTDWILGMTLGSLVALYIWRDVSKRECQIREQAEKISRLEEFNRQIVEQMEEGILVEDAQGRIAFTNNATLRLLGYEMEELIGKHWSSIVAPDSIERVTQELSSRPQGVSSRYRANLLSKEGLPVPVLVSARPLFDGDRFEGVLSVFTDIRRLLQAEQELQRRNERLAALQAITASVSRSLDLHQILAAALETASEVIGALGGVIYLYDRQTDMLSAEAHFNLPEAVLERIHLLHLGEGVSGQAAAERKLLIVPDLNTDPRNIFPSSAWEKYRALIAMPLVHQEAILGVLTLVFEAVRDFAPDDIEWLNTVGGQIAAAIHNAQLFDRVQHAKQEWEATVDSIGDAILIHDKDYRILRVNQTLAEWCGLPVRAILGRSCREVVSKLCGEQCSYACPAFNDDFGARAAVLELTLTDPWRVIERYSYPIRDDEGKIIAAVHVFHDVTESRRLQRELGQAGKLATLGELIAGVAHELNNPLTVILGNASLLEGEAMPADVSQRAAEIREAAQQCSRIVNDLLTFSRSREPVKEPIDLNACIRKALHLEMNKLRTSGIKVVTELSPNLPITVADPHRLQQVFLNLMVNARQAMEEVSKPGMLLIRSSRLSDDIIRIEISDNGPGIAPEVQARIFEPFFTTKVIGEGTGLGLTICERIMKEHGGNISVRSQAGKGSTFVLDLPIVSPDESTPQPSQEATPSVASTTPISALVVDDEPVVARFLQRILEYDGHRAVVETSGVRALERLARESFDAIFLDLRMPDLSGSALYQELRKSSPEMADRVIFVTGDTVDPTTQEFLRHSNRPCLTKPFTQQEFRAILAEFRSKG